MFPKTLQVFLLLYRDGKKNNQSYHLQSLW